MPPSAHLLAPAHRCLAGHRGWWMAGRRGQRLAERRGPWPASAPLAVYYATLLKDNGAIAPPKHGPGVPPACAVAALRRAATRCRDASTGPSVGLKRAARQTIRAWEHWPTQLGRAWMLVVGRPRPQHPRAGTSLEPADHNIHGPRRPTRLLRSETPFRRPTQTNTRAPTTLPKREYTYVHTQPTRRGRGHT